MWPSDRAAAMRSTQIDAGNQSPVQRERGQSVQRQMTYNDEIANTASEKRMIHGSQKLYWFFIYLPIILSQNSKIVTLRPLAECYIFNLNNIFIHPFSCKGEEETAWCTAEELSELFVLCLTVVLGLFSHK